MLNIPKILRRYPSVFAVALAALLYAALRTYFDIDLFEGLVDFLYRHEYIEADEVIFFIIVAVAALAADQTRNVRRQREKSALNKGRIQAVRATMATVHDIVNNALNNLVLIRFEAEKNKALCPETLASFEGLIEDTAKKLREIDALETFAEHNLAPGLTRLDLNQSTRPGAPLDL